MQNPLSSHRCSPAIAQLSLAAIVTPLTIALLVLAAMKISVAQDVLYYLVIVPFGIVTTLSLDSPYYFFPVAIGLFYLLHVALIRFVHTRKSFFAISFILSYSIAIPLMHSLYGYLF